MVRLNKASSVQWENLSAPGKEIEAGHVSFEMRRADGSDQAMAETNARASITRIVDGKIEAADFGLEQVGSHIWAEAIKTGEVDLWTGLGYQIFAVELAMIVGTAMRGVMDENDQPAVWNRRNVALLLQERIPDAMPFDGMNRIGSTFAGSFITIAMSPLRKAHDEGKS